MNWKSIWLVTIAATILLLIVPAASAQSCALCYTQAASAGSRMIQALKSGILILIMPPTLMTVGAIFICYRKRNQTREDFTEEPSDW
jgi:glycerol-3-phosphate acyltransferase PlsY